MQEKIKKKILTKGNICSITIVTKLKREGKQT